jgi:hypothetical protein
LLGLNIKIVYFTDTKLLINIIFLPIKVYENLTKPEDLKSDLNKVRDIFFHVIDGKQYI